MDGYRFYVPDLPLDAPVEQEIQLPTAEAHHARSVLRLAVGAEIVLFNGTGGSLRARITRLGKSGVEVQKTGLPMMEPPPAPALTLATAVPKGDRAEWLIEQASQLHATAVQFLDCDRSVVKPREGGQKLEKWKRLAVESAKQCGRSHLLEIREPVKLTEIRLRPADANRILWLDPGPGGAGVREAIKDWPGGVLALIGPEGGWSMQERKVLDAAAESGWVRRVRLTSTVLRIETACAALAAIVMSQEPSAPAV